MLTISHLCGKGELNFLPSCRVFCRSGFTGAWSQQTGLFSKCPQQLPRGENKPSLPTPGWWWASEPGLWHKGLNLEAHRVAGRRIPRVWHCHLLQARRRGTRGLGLCGIGQTARISAVIWGWLGWKRPRSLVIKKCPWCGRDPILCEAWAGAAVSAKHRRGRQAGNPHAFKRPPGWNETAESLRTIAF